jgi:hypothetical protein
LSTVFSAAVQQRAGHFVGPDPISVGLQMLQLFDDVV